ncbi:MAG: tyrosine-type recombinase/integrase [Synergistaceae bacterium]|nr:tyrosine-type recombinase/integrase [Synergistaceae bacterium]
MQLTVQEIKAAQPRNKPFCLSDGGGLLLEVHPNGSKYWICRIYHNRKEYRRGIGQFPDVSLKDARAKAAELRGSPFAAPRISGDFASAAEAYVAFAEKRLAENTMSAVRKYLRKRILPNLGGMRLDEITAPAVLAFCRSLEDEGRFASAKKCCQIVSQVFKYAIDCGQASVNPAAGVAGRLSPHKVRHFSALTEPDKIGGLMRALYGYPNIVLRCAMKLSAFAFCRPNEIRQAEWREFDVQKGVWIIPAEKMKLRQAHYVPLSRQAVEMLSELRRYTGGGRFLFPSPRGDGRCMSGEAVRTALRIMGFAKEEMTPHGFRSMASTVLNEYQFYPDAIELQLAHGEKDSVRGAYNRARHWDLRVAMVQWYSDFLDAVREGTPIPPKPQITITL